MRDRASGARAEVRASTASRTVGGTAAPPPARTSVTKKALPRVTRCSSPASTSTETALGQPRHGLRAQWCEREPPDRRSGEPTEQAPQRVSWIDGVVADGEDQEGRQRGDAPGEVADDVQGGVVGPVHVLDRHDGGTSHHRQDPRERVVSLCPVERGFHARVGQGHVPKRTERARGQQVVAATHDHVDRRGGSVEERRQQRGLAAARLPGDQDDRTARSGEGIVQGAFELEQRLLPLDQPAGDRAKRAFDAELSRQRSGRRLGPHRRQGQCPLSQRHGLRRRRDAELVHQDLLQRFVATHRPAPIAGQYVRAQQLDVGGLVGCIEPQDVLPATRGPEQLQVPSSQPSALLRCPLRVAVVGQELAAVQADRRLVVDESVDAAACERLARGGVEAPRVNDDVGPREEDDHVLAEDDGVSLAERGAGVVRGLVQPRPGLVDRELRPQQVEQTLPVEPVSRRRARGP